MAIKLESLISEQSRLNQNNSWQDKYVTLPQGEGSLTVRILGPAPGKELPWVVTRLHKISGRNYHSPMTLVRGKWQGICPLNTEYRKVWAEIEKLERQGKMDAAKELRNIANVIRPIERFYYNVIVRKEIKQNGEQLIDVGPKVLSIGKELQSRILNAMLGNPAMEDPGYGDITDFATGRDFRIRKKLRKSQAGSFPEYSESSFLSPSQAGTETQWKKWNETLWNLDEERKIRPIEELQDVIDVFMGRKEDSTLSVSHPEPSKPTAKPVVVTTEELEPDDDFLNELRNL